MDCVTLIIVTYEVTYFIFQALAYVMAIWIRSAHPDLLKAVRKTLPSQK